MNPKTTVMLVDDHAVVRAGYRLLLMQTATINVIREAQSGEEACQHYAEAQPDVVVMDLNMDGIGGLAAIGRIRARDPHARILVFSVHDETVYAARALEAGAYGYITKKSAPDIMVEAVLAIARGERYIEREIAQSLALQKTTGTSPADRLHSLSAREFDIFRLLAQGRTPREIAEELRLSPKTTANYSTGIKYKLGVNTTAEMARLAYQHGIFKELD